MTSKERRREWEREYKRKRRRDPVIRERIRAAERDRLNRDPAKHQQKNERARQRWARGGAVIEAANKRRLALGKQQQKNPNWREQFRKWQRDYFARHYGDDAFRQHRDITRVKDYYKTDDPRLIEAFSLMRQAKRKFSQSGRKP
jgi:hypothetical protein